MPAWDTVYGSGGRAAAAVSSLSPGTTLYAYAEDYDSEGPVSLRKLGIKICFSPRPSAIVFAYFHPLSRPHIQPPPNEIYFSQQFKLVVMLCFVLGFLKEMR